MDEKIEDSFLALSLVHGMDDAIRSYLAWDDLSPEVVLLFLEAARKKRRNAPSEKVLLEITARTISTNWRLIHIDPFGDSSRSEGFQALHKQLSPEPQKRWWHRKPPKKHPYLQRVDRLFELILEDAARLDSEDERAVEKS